MTGVSIISFSSANDCASTASLGYRIYAASSGYGDATIEVAQGGKTGTFTWLNSYPSYGTLGVAAFTTGSLTSWADVDKAQPFTVTFRFSVGADTFSDAIEVSKCSSPSTYDYIYTANDASGAGGSVSCKPNPVAKGKTTICTATANPGYIYDDGSIKLDGGSASDACAGDTCTLSNVQSDVTVSATFRKLHDITDASAPAAGSITCIPDPVPDGDTTICTATANPGYIYDDGSIKLDGGMASDACAGDTCTLSNVQSDVTVSATFTKAPPPPSGSAAAVPTLGEAGLLLSGLALAGAAAPALRRREKQGKKAYTRR